IIVCGKEVWGHKAGHSLFQLHQNGIDNKNRIIGSKSPDPILTAKHSEIKYFQKEIKLINLIGETSLKKISQHI
ncbi:MAG: tetrahydromethanopterin S-methyltransferase subunit A, partial [Candidatus Nitrosomaritimum aestuariumsis]